MRRIQSGLAASAGLSASLAALLATPALAEDKDVGRPHPWEMALQPGVTPVKHDMIVFHNYLLLPVITVITIFVLALLVYCIVRFNAKANPTPSRTTHNPLLEVAWTGLPVIILLVIAVPSFKLLYLGDRTVNADMTIKAIGHQWYWSYEYPDQGNFSFDAVMVEEKNLKPGEPRLLTTDTQIVVPVNANVRVLTTSDDVIHAWAVPAFGVKMDAMPGRLNETWFRAEKEGTYYGQCPELCGQNHGFMPIMVKVVSKEAFDAWAKKAKAEYGGDEPIRVRLAADQTAKQN